MALITFSNFEIEKKILEICDYGNTVLSSLDIKNKKVLLSQLFDDIGKLSKGIVSERSVLNKIAEYIKKQEHSINTVENINEPSVTPKEAAERLDRNRETVYRLCKQGDLDSMRLDNREIRISISSINKYLTQKRGV